MRPVNKGAIAVGLLAVLVGSGTVTLWVLGRHPGYCGQCHVMAPYAASMLSSELTAGRHSRANITCQQCHPQSLGDLARELLVTMAGRYTEPLPELKVSRAYCLECHGDYAQIIQATAKLPQNPHASHVGGEPCWRCHRIHRRSLGMKYCLGCHHTGDFVPCSQCHRDRQQQPRPQ